MKIIFSPPGGGKSFALIRLSHDTKGRIVCATPWHKQSIIEAAKEMGANISLPIVASDLRDGLIDPDAIDELYIDDLTLVLQTLIHPKYHNKPITIAMERLDGDVIIDNN